MSDRYEAFVRDFLERNAHDPMAWATVIPHGFIHTHREDNTLVIRVMRRYSFHINEYATTKSVANIVNAFITLIKGFRRCSSCLHWGAGSIAMFKDPYSEQEDAPMYMCSECVMLVSSRPPSEDACSICLEELNRYTLAEFSCGHRVHTRCMGELICSSERVKPQILMTQCFQDKTTSVRCPLCRSTSTFKTCICPEHIQ